ncbi:hypothetical protein ACFOQM_22710 [Paenibacillus sp. GCM10012307]|uniref:Uncharacterized protein n=1 Tax=Paenibacillus roseus TaxID=2798579 RepID=A0A934JBD3_9BACL|nr:hypothetical protein [Paenibacillus roseus]MBJ6364041.1 hypothetical protein [Paenibacillus roseus]
MTKTINELVTQLLALTTPEFQELIDKLKKLEPLQNILDIASEPDRSRILQKLMTFAEQDAQPFSYDPVQPDHFSPSYKRFDFVDCYFTGVGFEWDAKHIALI